LFQNRREKEGRIEENQTFRELTNLLFRIKFAPDGKPTRDPAPKRQRVDQFSLVGAL
jgi:hypothetical protein